MAIRQPSVIWAQRESFLYVTIEIDDVAIEDLTADNSKLHFKGTSHTEVFETTLEFFDEIDGAGMKRTPTNTRVIELNIPKKEAKWWPRLLKEKGKVHWLKVDFDKWKDEDDSGAEDGMPSYGGAGGFDLNSYMNQMGGDMGNAPDFDDLDDGDDAEMPDLEDDEDDTEYKAETGEKKDGKADNKENKE
ncbi:CS domain protein [Dictyocaulus viviparus]|uniref:CS domain protein n=1 Tax=Dictyocaulus viviparus TaxID=29172 RepID=A0A0D8Y8V8_DICVI|nr:CS domain protein [Dictyocaulus viviparus]